MFLVATLNGGCAGVPDGVTTVSDFELARYLGTWYEVARLDHRFERGMSSVTANYSMRDDGGVSVVNRGFEASKDEWTSATGKAYLDPNGFFISAIGVARGDLCGNPAVGLIRLAGQKGGGAYERFDLTLGKCVGHPLDISIQQVVLVFVPADNQPYQDQKDNQVFDDTYRIATLGHQSRQESLIVLVHFATCRSHYLSGK